METNEFDGKVDYCSMQPSLQIPSLSQGALNALESVAENEVSAVKENDTQVSYGSSSEEDAEDGSDREDEVEALKLTENAEETGEDGDEGNRIENIEESQPKTKRKRARVRKRRRRRRGRGGAGVSEPGSGSADPQQRQQPIKCTPKKKPHDAPMKKRDLYYSMRCGLIKVLVESPIDVSYPNSTSSNNERVIRKEKEVVARITVVNWDNQIVMDEFVQPQLPPPVQRKYRDQPPPTPSKDVIREILDYRTEKTGVNAQHLKDSNRAIPLENVRNSLRKIIKGKILIGHMIPKCMEALGMSHPWCDSRDVAQYAPYMNSVYSPSANTLTYNSGNASQSSMYLDPADLSSLFTRFLHWEARGGGLLGEAIGCMELYKRARTQWETDLAMVTQRKKFQSQSPHDQYRNIRYTDHRRQHPQPVQRNDYIRFETQSVSSMSSTGSFLQNQRLQRPSVPVNYHQQYQQYDHHGQERYSEPNIASSYASSYSDSFSVGSSIYSAPPALEHTYKGPQGLQTFVTSDDRSSPQGPLNQFRENSGYIGMTNNQQFSHLEPNHSLAHTSHTPYASRSHDLWDDTRSLPAPSPVSPNELFAWTDNVVVGHPVQNRSDNVADSEVKQFARGAYVVPGSESSSEVDNWGAPSPSSFKKPIGDPGLPDHFLSSLLDDINEECPTESVPGHWQHLQTKHSSSAVMSHVEPEKETWSPLLTESFSALRLNDVGESNKSHGVSNSAAHYPTDNQPLICNDGLDGSDSLKYTGQEWTPKLSNDIGVAVQHNETNAQRNVNLWFSEGNNNNVFHDQSW